MSKEKCTDNDFTEPEKYRYPVFWVAIRSTVYHLVYYNNDVGWSLFCKQAREMTGSNKNLWFNNYHNKEEPVHILKRFK